MAFKTPSSKVSRTINGLGKLEGFQYANGVEQFCGIPYATLPKRWTRASLRTSWENDCHDGTQLGSMCPRPRVTSHDSSPFNPFIPVPPNPAFTRAPNVDEKTALNLNVVIPQYPTPHGKRFPVMAWIHGGSLMFGSASYSIYDGVNLVSQSIAIGLPIVMVSFNYRLGLGGFLASSKIADELKQDGFAGNGKFGFTDQKVAMEWVQKYIAQFGGDPDNVTAVGQSAGGISIGHHMVANDPINFIALCEHETLFNATCRHFSIDPRSSDALNQLRQVAQQVLADEDNVIQNVNMGTGNPCDDGWFYARSPNDVSEAPTWLKSFLIGDVHDEGVVFIENLQKDTYDTVRSTMITHVLNETFVDTVLKLYHIHAGVTGQDLINRVCNMGADAVFKIQNYQTALVNRRLQEEKTLVKYHVDQRSRLPNILLGKAYHGIDILYLFGNLKNKFNEDELAMALDFQSAWIQFINGQTPWQSDHTIWKIWGPNSLQRVETEREDEAIRRYSRFKCLLALGTADHLWDKYLEAMDFLLMKRDNAGTGEKGE